jgi:hypothetical protein
MISSRAQTRWAPAHARGDCGSPVPRCGPARHPRRSAVAIQTHAARFGRVYEDGEGTIEVSSAFEAFAWAAEQVAERKQPDQPLIRLMDGQESLWDADDACLECQSVADIFGHHPFGRLCPPRGQSVPSARGT